MGESFRLLIGRSPGFRPAGNFLNGVPSGTIGLAARFKQFYPVVIGTTLSVILANIPVVLIGDRPADRLAAAVVFAGLAALTLAGSGR
ncbi:MAG: TMEM165/GDT1 family protein [Stellaceae bacterium]